METDGKEQLKKAMEGDIHAFQSLFAEFQAQLKSYLYRLTANRNDAEDLTHDTFIRAYDRIRTFRGDASLKTWVFSIATSMAYNMLQKRNRWTVDVSQQAKSLVLGNQALADSLEQVAATSETGRYEIREHIDTCFTCMSKTLPVENQIALMLRDIYGFSVKEICLILEKTEGVVKYLLQDARQTMTDIFDHRCALVNKAGACHQCSELNGWFNPRQNQQEALLQTDLVKGSRKYDRDALYRLRTQLVQAIDPLRSPGADLQELLMKCNRMAMGEA